MDKTTLAIRRREVHHKDLVIEYGPDGGTRQRALPEEEALRPVLTDEEVVAVAELGGASSSTTAPRRTPSGRSTPTARCGCCRAGQSPLSMTRHLQSEPATTQTERRAVLLRGLGGAPGSGAVPVRVLGSLEDAASS